MNSTEQAVKYSIEFEDTETKRSSDKINSLLVRMSKMVEAVGIKAIEVKQKVIRSLTDMVTKMTEVFDMFRKKMLNIFSPIKALVGAVIGKFLEQLQLAYSKFQTLVEWLDKGWQRIRGNGITHLKNMFIMTEEQKRYNKELESSEKLVDKMREHWETIKETAKASVPVTAGLLASQDLFNLRNLPKMGFSDELIKSLPNMSRGIANERFMNPDDVLQAAVNLGRYNDKLKTNEELMRAALTTSADWAAAVDANITDVSNVMGKLNENYGVSNEQIEKMIPSYQKLAQMSGAPLKDILKSWGDIDIAMTSANVRGEEATDYMMRMTAVYSVLQKSGTDASVVMKTLTDVQQKGLTALSKDQSVITQLTQAMGMGPEAAHELAKKDPAQFFKILTKGMIDLRKSRGENIFQELMGTEWDIYVKGYQQRNLSIDEFLEKAFAQKGTVKGLQTTTGRLKQMAGDVSIWFRNMGTVVNEYVLDPFTEFIKTYWDKGKEAFGHLSKTTKDIVYGVSAAAMVAGLAKPVTKGILGILTAPFKLLGRGGGAAAAEKAAVSKGLSPIIKSFIFNPMAEAFEKLSVSPKFADSIFGAIFKGLGVSAKSAAKGAGLRGAILKGVFNALKGIGGQIEIFSGASTFGKGLNFIFEKVSLIAGAAMTVYEVMTKWSSAGGIQNIADALVGINGSMTTWKDRLQSVLESVIRLSDAIMKTLFGPISTLTGWLGGSSEDQIAAGKEGKVASTPLSRMVAKIFGKEDMLYTPPSPKTETSGGLSIKAIDAIYKMNAMATGQVAIPPGSTRTGKATSSRTGGGNWHTSTSATPARNKPLAGGKYDSIINAAAAQYNVDPKLLTAIIRQESGGKADAVSPKGAAGLMQIIPSTAMDLGITPEERFDPEKNVFAGAKYISQLLKQYGGNEELALAAYNAGPNAVNKYGGVPPYQETENYVSKIMAERAASASSPVQIDQTEVVSVLKDIYDVLAHNRLVQSSPTKTASNARPSEDVVAVSSFAY